MTAPSQLPAAPERGAVAALADTAEQALRLRAEVNAFIGLLVRNDRLRADEIAARVTTEEAILGAMPHVLLDGEQYRARRSARPPGPGSATARMRADSGRASILLSGPGWRATSGVGQGR